ncbi:MAG: Nramp family divalent metal transporter [Nitrospirae bacterium]|nr:Nramp family divalent metal transporter [Nitrospirota bacterium]MCL5421619.1 Nramp family divalent metal transporter [Nitrospirota bacterium]
MPVILKKLFEKHAPKLGGLDILKYIGPGFLVTVGFIDPGNWASNVAAGSGYGYSLLWMVTLSTLMLIILQHTAAHLGIATGLCLSEASAKYLGKWISRLFLLTAVLASVSTALAEILGAAIGLNMLVGLPITVGAILSALLAAYMLLSRSYRRLEKWIIAFVSLIGLSFLFELTLVKVGWNEALMSWVIPSIPTGSLPIVMSVLGAVVMPHNIFLHSEIIQSRQWNLEGDEVIRKQLKYEFTDTLFAMTVGWAINSAMIIVAASVFHANGITVGELPQAQTTLKPLLGDAAASVFALALILAGFSSSITAAMAGGSIFAGAFQEPFDPADSHSRMGVVVTLLGALVIILFVQNPFKAMIWSQIILSIQLPFTIFALIYLTSSSKVMGKFSNPVSHKIFLWLTALIVTFLNVMLVVQLI